MHIRNLKQALNHGLVLKNVYIVKLNQRTQLKSYLDMNREHGKKIKK